MTSTPSPEALEKATVARESCSLAGHMTLPYVCDECIALALDAFAQERVDAAATDCVTAIADAEERAARAESRLARAEDHATTKAHERAVAAIGVHHVGCTMVTVCMQWLENALAAAQGERGALQSANAGHWSNHEKHQRPMYGCHLCICK